LLFRSQLVTAHWDTWCYYHDGTFYLYYLITERGYGHGFGVATSPDGVHWDDHGWAIRASDKMVGYLGTGSVWSDLCSPGRFLCNYSEWRDDGTGKAQQKILFASSDDLIHWNKLGDDHMFGADERHYERYGRWDCICAFPRPQSGYWGTWTATPKGYRERAGGVGVGHSDDGVHWEAYPPARVIPDVKESAAMTVVDGVFHAMFGRNMRVIGNRADLVGPLRGAAGFKMIAYQAADIRGPFHEAPKNPVLLTRGHAYFSRLFDGPDCMLINHHVMDGRAIDTGRPITYAAPFKRFAIDSEGNQRWHWWPGNDALRGRASDPSQPADFQRGVLFEFGIETGNARGLGALIVLEIDGDEYCISVSSDDVVLFSSNAAEYGWQRSHMADRGKPFAGRHMCRVLSRAGLLELYIGDEFIECWTMGCPEGRTVRLVTERSAVISPVAHQFE
jgi:hypothetical protein